MNTTNLLWIICISLGVAVAAVAATMVGLLEDNRNLRREIGTARSELKRVGEEVKELDAEKGDLNAELASQRDELQKAESDLADAKETNSMTNAAPTPRPVKVRTYLANQYVGMSWLVPSGLSKDPKTGVVTYEPILVLEDSVRQNLVSYKTNVVEREVSGYTTVNYNYPWVYYYPIAFFVGTNRTPHCAGGNMPQTVPSDPPRPQNSQPFFSTTIHPPTTKPFLPAIRQPLPSPNRVGWAGGFQQPTSGPGDPTKKALSVWVPSAR